MPTVPVTVAGGSLTPVRDGPRDGREPAEGGAICNLYNHTTPQEALVRLIDGLTDRFWLILGPRPDGSFYNRDERDTLAEIADPIARALAVATQHRQREHAIERAMETMADSIAALQRRLDTLDSAAGDPV